MHASDVAFLVLLPQSGSFRKMEIRDGTTMLAQGREGLPPVHGHGLGKTVYERHQPEQTLLYQLVERHYPALVPKPRINLTRYHGVLAPNHRWRGLVTPARRGKGVKSISNAQVRPTAERHAAMSWAQRLKRVFNIDMPQGTL